MKFWFVVWKWKLEKASSLDWRVENTFYEGAHPLAFLKTLLQRLETEGTRMEYRLLWWSELDQATFDTAQDLHLDQRGGVT